MSVSVLVLSHEGIGAAILGAALQMIAACPMETTLLTIEQDGEPDDLIERAKLLLDTMDSGDGVLVLTDLYGSTPCNIAKACISGKNAIAVAGLNLSMLIRVMNYPDLGLSELSEKATSGGKDGIIILDDLEHHAS
jgi:PTS system mannose-specific IIA component